ncbi:kinase-like domain-containing protein [Pavlovales sp. CCMP2436]|nr:kinase-like domain-containing protein [Pavlovales sp. CCMP2436]
MADTSALSLTNVCAFVHGLLPLEGCPLLLGDDLACAEVHGGNLNYAFRVHDASTSTRSVFVKQAPEFIKCLGPEARLSSWRAKLESAALLVFNSLAPSHTPRHLHFDAVRAAIVMEDLREHVMLRDELLAGRVLTGDARALGEFMARTHALTMRPDPMAGPAASPSVSYSTRFDNELLCGITSAYVFLMPFDTAEASNRHSAALDSQVAGLRSPGSRPAAAAAALERIFRGKRQCLIHGDLHAGSVMVARAVDPGAAASEPEPEAYANGRLRVIDPEFACYGPAGFDLGLALSAYAFAYFHHAAFARVPILKLTKQAVRALWAEYALCLTELLDEQAGSVVGSAAADSAAGLAVTGSMVSSEAEADTGFEAFLLRTLREAVGFMGAELTRRVIGAAHVPDLDGIADEQLRVAAERAALACGVKALESWEGVEGIEGVLNLIFGN